MDHFKKRSLYTKKKKSLYNIYVVMKSQNATIWRDPH